jgi:hypothetical protein
MITFWLAVTCIAFSLGVMVFFSLALPWLIKFYSWYFDRVMGEK